MLFKYGGEPLRSVEAGECSDFDQGYVRVQQHVAGFFDAHLDPFSANGDSHVFLKTLFQYPAGQTNLFSHIGDAQIAAQVHLHEGQGITHGGLIGIKKTGGFPLDKFVGGGIRKISCSIGRFCNCRCNCRAKGPKEFKKALLADLKEERLIRIFRRKQKRCPNPDGRWD